MVRASGTAVIKHAKSGYTYEIDSNILDFEVVAIDDRQMGPETTYAAILHHPQLGELSWHLWEYPVGMENDKDTDVGPHELIENIEFDLGHEPSDDFEEEEDRQNRVDMLVEWFHQNYEDPAARLPYISAEGGYQWIYGGPYDAREELFGNFPDEKEDIIEAAIEEIESDGLFDWAPTPKPDDYDDFRDEEPPEGGLNELLRELSDIVNLNSDPTVYPVFDIGTDGRLHIATLPTPQNNYNADLLEELRNTTSDLLQSLTGTNAYTVLLNKIEGYNSAITQEPLSISRLYAWGVKIENAAHATNTQIENEDLPSMPMAMEQNLKSLLEIHHAFIMSHEDGRELAESASLYRLSSEQTIAFKMAAERISQAINDLPSAIAEGVSEQVLEAVKEIGAGPEPERSNQIATTTLSNLALGILKLTTLGGSIWGAAVIEQAFVGSTVGVSLTATGINTINILSNFAIAHIETFKILAVSGGRDLAWLNAASHLLEKIRDRYF